MARRDNQYRETYLTLTWTDPQFGGTVAQVFDNNELALDIEVTPRTTVTTFETREGRALQTRSLAPWRWSFELQTELPATYQKLDDIYDVYLRDGYGLRATLNTGYPLYSASADGMQNVVGINFINPAILEFDKATQRAIGGGIGTRWRLGNLFAIAESVAYPLPTNANQSGNGGGQ